MQQADQRSPVKPPAHDRQSDGGPATAWLGHAARRPAEGHGVGLAAVWCRHNRRRLGRRPGGGPATAWLRHPTRRHENGPDSGVATIWTAIAVAALTGVAVLGFWIAAAVIARHRAETAADLGALAAASHAAEGSARACERARWVADRMGVTLLTCRWQRLDALVEVRAPGPGLAGLPGPSARARAGPAGPAGPAGQPP